MLSEIHILVKNDLIIHGSYIMNWCNLSIPLTANRTPVIKITWNLFSDIDKPLEPIL